MAKTFAASVAAFRDLTAKNMKYVAASAIQDVVAAAQTPQPSVERTGGSFEIGKIPVKSSELINSLSVDGQGQGELSYVVAIAGFEIGDKMQFEWTSGHALPIEAGWTAPNGTQVPGRHFVGANAARFSEFVDARVAEVRK